jgi:hypothetical protein
MLTLSEAIDSRLRQASLVGWRVGARKQIEIVAGVATLILGWSDNRGLAPAEPGARKVGDHIVSVDLDNLPLGVSAFEWDALPDSHDLIEIPTDDEVKTAARQLGCKWVDKGIGSNRLIYWIR